MRPVRIEVEGFSAYRSKEFVDLTGLRDSDLPFFSLSGATGAGKSSLVDAMIFALYGRIPRLGGTAVAPVISAGTDRARVRLDFDVDGVTHTAVRLAQRTPNGGATIKEARLERGDQVLADGADKVTAAVEELLRLGFDDFTRTVVLPQGDFARFLNATRAERQALLRGILGLGVYSKVRELATGRQAVAADRASGASTRLEALHLPDEVAAGEARARLAMLESMAGSIVEQERALAALSAEEKTRGEVAQRLQGARARLEALSAPADLGELGELMDRARGGLAEAEETHDEAVSTLRQIEERREELPDPEVIVVSRRNQQSLDQVISRIEAMESEDPEHSLQEAETRWERSRSAVDDLRKRGEALRLSHAAHSIGATLTVGEPCPVCHHPVGALPDTKTPPELDRIEAELEAAEAQAVADRDVVERARAAVTEHQTTLANLGTMRDELGALLAGAPDGAELTRLEALGTELKVQYEGARRLVTEADQRLSQARKELEELSARQYAMGRLLTTAQLQVADLGPPVSESDDVVVQWKDLMAWRGDALARVESEHTDAVEAATQAAAAHAAARDSILEAMTAAGVTPLEPFSATLAGESERARQLVASHEQAMAEAAALRAEIESETSNAEVAAVLAGHLRANGFEQWMMAGAIATLVVGANDLLAQLSEGGYSLHSDEGSFTIIDHRNADEKRSVSTLSGGETFLVSLALALSLAETLASAGGARLDSIILDEGFGTLDDESLDTVATVLEELAGAGLMVGVITHVKELASRAAVRFEVTRGARGSTVRESR